MWIEHIALLKELSSFACRLSNRRPQTYDEPPRKDDRLPESLSRVRAITQGEICKSKGRPRSRTHKNFKGPAYEDK